MTAAMLVEFSIKGLNGFLQPPETLLSQFLDAALGWWAYVGGFWDGGGNIVLRFIQGFQNGLKSSLLHTEVVLHTKKTDNMIK